MLIKDEEHSTVKKILKTHIPNAKAWMFGSRIDGTAKEYSDLDILIKINAKKIPLKTISKLQEAFDESDLTFKVDIVDWNRITKEFRDIAISNNIPIDLAN